jgi:HEAT repeat protein
MMIARIGVALGFAAGVLVAAPAVAQHAGTTGAGAATAGSLASLAGLARLEGLRSLEGLRGLGALHALEGLGNQAALQGLASLRALESLDAITVTRGPRLGAGDDEDRQADSLYREARRALDRGDYRRAAGLFQQVRSRDPRARIAADALYWHAYSMYRLGGTTGLESALASLQTLASDHPRASVEGDARDLRLRVCSALARQGDERCAAEITERVTQSQQGCPDEDDDERIAALNALLQMDAERALPILERTLARRDACSVNLRRKAVFLVSQKRDPKAADILLNAVRTDPDREVRSQAVFWLGQLRDDRAVTILEGILRDEKDEDVLDKAIFALSQQRSSRAGTLLRDLAMRDNAPTRLREQAIFWLGQQKSGENAELLMNLYRRVPSETLKDKIIFSLSQMRSAATDKWMLDIAMDQKEDIEMRKKALFWAGQNRSVSAEGIAAIYDRVSDQEMREQVIFVLSQRKDAAAVDKLIDIAKNDKDREMRKKALFWLSQSRDPRVIKLLEEILNK